MTTIAQSIATLARGAVEALAMAGQRAIGAEYGPEDGTEITDYTFEDGSVLAVSGRDYWAREQGDVLEEIEMPTNQEIASALRELVRLHKDWDKGTAYVPVAFMQKNNAAIAEAKRILAQLDNA